MRYLVATESSNLNVRADSGLDWPILRRLARGTTVEVARVAGEWSQLASGGWVATRFLRPAAGPGVAPAPGRETPGARRLPPWRALWENYPAIHDTAAVKRAIGGDVDGDWLTYTCTIRLSRALNYGGDPIPPRSPGLHVVNGADGLRYAYKVREMRGYLSSRYGPPSIDAAPEDALEALFGRPGIILFEVDFSDATGHFDIWNGQWVRYREFFHQARCVLLWKTR
jgi:hypothetical protein